MAKWHHLPNMLWQGETKGKFLAYESTLHIKGDCDFNGCPLKWLLLPITSLSVSSLRLFFLEADVTPDNYQLAPHKSSKSLFSHHLVLE